VKGITIATLAKRLEEVYSTESDYPIIFPRTSEELFLLQRIRDEAHRFAITAQRKSRSKSISSTLIEIPGLGEARARLLLRKFGSIKRIRAASDAEIESLPGFGKKLAEQIRSALSEDGNSDTPDTPKR
jgi:excinuclease ABC subunit C